MIVRPAGKRRDVVRPALLVDEAHARDLDDGTVWPLKSLPKTLRAYVSWDDADRYARAGQGELVAWGDEPIRYRHERRGDSYRRTSDAVIVKLPVDTRAQLERGLVEWADWLAGYDVNPGWSLGGTSMNLLRATLDGPLVTTAGELPAPRWTLGGRQQSWVEPGTAIHGAVQLDLPAAYTHVIGGLRYGGAWRHLQRPDATIARLAGFHTAGLPVLVRARVALPAGLTVGPLHRRPQRRPETGLESITNTVPYPEEGSFAGTWTYAEVGQAIAVGASVRVTEAWVHTGGGHPFAPWHEAVMEGRDLDGFAGLLAKATGNALWGQFVIDDHKRLVVQRWNGAYTSRPVQGSRGHQKRAWDVGELVCGTVRARLYQMLHGYADSLICCHTDGFWIRDDGKQPIIIFDDWRMKTDAAELHILDQQRYRYRLRRARTFQVVCAGVPSDRSADVFQELWERFA